MSAAVGVLPVAGIQVSIRPTTASPGSALCSTDRLQIDYDDELTKIEEFLTRFEPQRRANGQQTIPDNDDDEADSDAEELADDLSDMGVNGEGDRRTKAKYMRMLRKVANRQTSEVVVDLADVRNASV